MVERAIGWLGRFRRLARDYGRLAVTLTNYHWITFIVLLLAHVGFQSQYQALVPSVPVDNIIKPAPPVKSCRFWVRLSKLIIALKENGVAIRANIVQYEGVLPIRQSATHHTVERGFEVEVRRQALRPATTGKRWNWLEAVA